jgi:nucleoside phosphorylase
MYTPGRIGSHNVVLVLLPNMGKTSAAAAGAMLRTSYINLRLALLVGICGGIPIINGEEAVLEDVIIGKIVVQYDFGRQ